MDKVRKALGMGITCALVAALTGCFAQPTVSGPQVASTNEGTTMGVITVNASSEVRVVPDKASFNVSVVTQGETPEEAQQASVQPVEAVIEALRQAGLDDRSIQTSYTNLSPRYDWSGEVEAIVGYEMRTAISVSDVDVDGVSELMSACVAAGATGVDGPSYYASSYDEAYAEALAQAVASSQDKAQAMANAAGVKLGEVVSIVEGYQNTSFRYAEEMEMEMDVASSDALDAGAGAAKVSPGEVSIEAQVTVGYAID